MTQTIICDLDGTLCNIEHRRHLVEGEKKNWKLFFDEMHKDTANAWCVLLLAAMRSRPATEIVFVTGRPDSHKGMTEEWLSRHGFAGNDLFMRKTGDYRPDWQIKEEILNKHLKDRLILFVIDDRKQVVDMWRRNGS